jgi:hypothetical protein
MNLPALTIAAIMIIPGSVTPVYSKSVANKIQYQIQSRLEAGEKPNKLINEKSPYLLQHAFNPVDWYPWGEEAFELAAQTDKPNFHECQAAICNNQSQ